MKSTSVTNLNRQQQISLSLPHLFERLYQNPNYETSKHPQPTFPNKYWENGKTYTATKNLTQTAGNI
jgi:hypothetical protein